MMTLITPEVAESLLLLNTRNRPISKPHVTRLIEELKTGRWKVNGDTIKISKTNKLLDGQHRLTAVVKSGISIYAFVIRDLDDDVFDTIDIPKVRSAGNTLSLAGEKNATRIAAALIVVDQYRSGDIIKLTKKYGNRVVLELLAANPLIRDSIQVKHHVVRHANLIPPSVMDACHYLFSLKDRALADEFIEAMIEGSTKGTPWHMLRERLVANATSKANLPRNYIMALCIKSWNSARTGKKLGVLKWCDDEDFPTII
jgi:hypothetical protein